MPSPYIYFAYAFGQNADDLTAIPVNAAVDGSVSYYAGWTDPYEYNLVTNPAALPIPRGQMNQLFYDITNNLQEYQQYGTPQWVTGNTVSYPIYARVYYLGVVYENQVSSNTVTPGTDATWRVISGNVGGIPIGTVIDFAGPIVPTDFILCDGSGILRTTYASLLSSLSQTQNGTTTNTLFTISGLSSTANMFIGMHVEGSGIQPGTTIASIVDSNDITISLAATASATVPLQFFNWGNGDGSTTFNLPDFRRHSSIGSGGTGTSVIGNVTGQSGGVESYSLLTNDMPQHTHNPSPSSNYFRVGVSGTGNIDATGGTLNAQGNTTGGITGWGPQTPISLYSPNNVVTKCIKYQ